MERSDISAEMVYNSLSLYKKRHLLLLFGKNPQTNNPTSQTKELKQPKNSVSLFKIKKEIFPIGPQM